MTIAEQREKLRLIISRHKPWETSDDLLAAISAAGFSIIGPEVTTRMLQAASAALTEDSGKIFEVFKAMLAAGDLASKPE